MLNDSPEALVTPPAGGAARRRWFGLVIISLGVSLIIVDTTIVNVAVPSIIDDLGISSSQAQWVQEVYTLVFASLLLLCGRLADRSGGAGSSPSASLVFGLASVLAALAASRRRADRRAGGAGHRRRADPADVAVAAERDVPRS